eukprot:FR741611.1.p1 GENE.FR741611.1~~FR741611.1.p1  ORF type:complete len:143 (+),score=5.67 FR741611.1:35-430(+)
MTGGNKTHPHPPQVTSDAELADWARLPEANMGVFAYHAGRPQTQKLMQDFCAFLKTSLGPNGQPGVLGDQYAFRAALWVNRAVINASRLGSGQRQICRERGRCKGNRKTLCAVVHGWKYMRKLVPNITTRR